MATNLRIQTVVVVDSTTINATFSSSLNENIGVANISITAQTPGVPDPSVLDVRVDANTLTITTQPLTQFAAYFITFASTDTVPFNSLNGDATLLNNNAANRQLIIGPIEPNNPVKEYLTNFFRNNVYDLEDTSTFSKLITALSTTLSKSLYDIRQTKNENYLSHTIVDEPKTRSGGPFDRLNEESAYEVLRVGLGKTDAIATFTSSIGSFPDYPVSLLATSNTENLTASSSDITGTFNINSFTLNLSERFVIILDSVIFTYSSSSYTYDIDKFGYQILTSAYDPNFAFTYLQLTDSQIRLNEAILGDSGFSTEGIQSIQVKYQFKDTGKVIDPTSLSVVSVITSSREVLPPIENIFALKHAPIVSANNSDGTIGDITFTDPNALLGSNSKHPAFLYEVAFRLDYLPSRIGEYSIDYSAGTIYVYGSSDIKDGTGAYPPLATYRYRHVFKSNVDYVYDTDTSDLVSLPNGSLTESSAIITYNYEEVLVQGVDYKVASHIEALNERVDNRLVAMNAIQTKNSPITSVFRILNETTGEVYKTLRWSDTNVFFSFNKAPNLVEQTGERVSFEDVFNEILFVSATLPNSIFKVFLANNNIIGSTEDCIGSSINSSAKPSNTNIFQREVYFDNGLTEAQNNARLTVDGYYQIDYLNGIVWCKVPISQDLSIGTISYKRGYVLTEHPHIITVDDIYYRTSLLNPKGNHFDYTTFSDTTILPSSFDVSDEGFIASNLPYQINNKIVGTFQPSFVPGVKTSIKFVRGVFEHQDLLNSLKPLDFSLVSSANGTTITVDSLEYEEYHTVQYDGYDYYVLANTDLLYQSPNITTSISITRLSDSAQLWDGSGIVVLGAPVKFVLSGNNTPAAGDPVLLSYSYTINNLSRVIVDYNRGDYFVDYTYLADEIIVSYEYGNNALDFRQSSALSAGDNYFVSYKVGALRDALLKNFGTLINIDILNSLDTSFDRERYRDALMAAMQSFTAGPTLTSMKNIVSTIVHTPPEIKESAFASWTLGNTLITPQTIKTEGEFSLVPAKYGNGVLVDGPGQSISFPTSSNLRLEQGSLECWIVPKWNGIDNQSTIDISITKNNTPLKPEQIFIGPSAYHPTFGPDGYRDGYAFSLDTSPASMVFGTPNKSKDGVFIYYAADQSGNFNRWYFDVLDGYGDGYGIKNYKVSVKTPTGKIYDVKSKTSPQPSSAKIYSGTNSFNYTITGLAQIDQGITFIADDQHYIFDFGHDTKSNRFSLFKDESGYINFRVIDKDGINYIVGSDISDWKAGEQHHVAAAWSLASKNGRDELHLFIDGFEVPNIIKYKNKVSPYLHEKFRTVDPEEVIGVIDSNIIASTDLSTTIGSNVVSSLTDFTAAGILSGDTIFIEELGFSTTGYTISSVSGQSLTLSSSMPATITNGKFSVNKTSFDVKTEIDLYPNRAVSLLHSLVSGTDLQTTANSDTVSSPSTDFTALGVKVGYLLRIVEPDLPSHYNIVSVSGMSLVLDGYVPDSYSSAPFFVYSNVEEEIPGVRALRPAYEMSRDGYFNNILTIRDKAIKNDIVLIRTLGLNNRCISQKYYVWGNDSNVIMTRLPSPILLDDVRVNHILLDTTIVGPSNSTFGGGLFTSNNIPTDQPSLSDTGRTLSVYVSGSNIDFSTPVTITITGTINNVPSSTETLTFTYATTESTINKLQSVDYVVVVCKPFNSSKNCLVFSIKELNPITIAEDSTNVPTIRYSYQVFISNTLSGNATNVVSDAYGFFSVTDINNYLVIHSPPSVAGQYQILNVADDKKSATISSVLGSSFTGGNYEVLNASTYRSGLQNGFFTFEDAYAPGLPYPLVQGLYEFDYYSYLSIPMNTTSLRSFVGSAIDGYGTANAIIDELKIYSEKLTDTRIGETIGTNQESITKDFNSLKQLKSSSDTLLLSHFDTFPFTNDADVYVNSTNQFIQSSNSINDNFNKSIYLLKEPIIVDNTGILNEKDEGTIEFWVNPIYDTANDPNYRFYFDASSIVIEKITSTNNATVKILGRASKVLSVKIQHGSKDVDYFIGGTIDTDNQTLFLNKALPNQQTPVVVSYIPTGVVGDRISIYKDPAGYINFVIRANNVDYQLRAPTFWTKNTWHRLKATFKVNGGLSNDEIRFFVDGYESGTIAFGNGLLFGQNLVFGSSFVGSGGLSANISFKDTINELFIGSDYTGRYGAYALIDNLRISNISRPLFMPFGESIDVNYSSNTDIVFPVTTDLYTTLLLDFNTLVAKVEDFAMLKNKVTGLNDFSISIFDEFGIVASNPKVKEVLETLINALKSASSRVFIRYVD